MCVSRRVFVPTLFFSSNTRTDDYFNKYYFFSYTFCACVPNGRTHNVINLFTFTFIFFTFKNTSLSDYYS